MAANGQLHESVALPHEKKKPSYTLNRRINGPQIALNILEKKRMPCPYLKLDQARPVFRQLA